MSFFSSKPRIIKTSHRVKIVESFYNLIGYVKLVKKPTFFTIFDVQSSEYQIINNPFKLLESKLGKIKEKNGIYIIGTNSSILDFKDYTYRDYIISLHKYIMCKYLVDEIYYCPHRRDRNLEDIIVLCKHLGIKIYDTKVSVEYDFIENNINPKLIIGFTSNALFTLHLLYPSTDIKTVMYNLKSEQADTETQIIRNRLNESGISTIEIF